MIQTAERDRDWSNADYYWICLICALPVRQSSWAVDVGCRWTHCYCDADIYVGCWALPGIGFDGEVGLVKASRWQHDGRSCLTIEKKKKNFV